MNEVKPKKVFISYAWTSQQYVDYVVDVATRLATNGVEVILDQWDLKPGQDKNHFMEQSVKDPTIDKVLMLIDKAYAGKADSRKGGVGTESIIISQKVYSDLGNEKFIPIVTEVDENNEPYLPVFLESRIYVNFANESSFEEEFEKLVRLIYNAPARVRPQLGSAPSYLTEESVNTFKTGFFVKSSRSQLDRNPNSADRLLNEFFQIFEEELWSFEMSSINDDTKPYGQLISERLHSYQDIKKNFVDFVLMISTIEYQIDESIIVSFFEKFHCYLRPKDENVPLHYKKHYEIFIIIFPELFLYTLTACMKNNNYKLAGELLYATYVFDCKHHARENGDKSFCGIIDFPEIYKNFHQQLLSPVGNYYLNNLYKFSKEEFVTTDIICHISSFLFQRKRSYYGWYPYSNIVYGSHRSHVRFKFFEKLSSAKFYEKVKPIFNDFSVNSLKQELIKYRDSNDRRITFGTFNEIPFIHEFIPPEKLASER